MLARQSVDAEIAGATTRNLLVLAQQKGIIPGRGGSMAEDKGGCPDSESDGCDYLHSANKTMTKPAVHPAIRRYSQGEISALRAAAIPGDSTTVGEVIFMTKQAGLASPQPPVEQELVELARARRVLGIDVKTL